VNAVDWDGTMPPTAAEMLPILEAAYSENELRKLAPNMCKQTEMEDLLKAWKSWSTMSDKFRPRPVRSRSLSTMPNHAPTMTGQNPSLSNHDGPCATMPDHEPENPVMVEPCPTMTTMNRQNLQNLDNDRPCSTMSCVICGKPILTGFMVWLNDHPAHSPKCPEEEGKTDANPVVSDVRDCGPSSLSGSQNSAGEENRHVTGADFAKGAGLEVPLYLGRRKVEQEIANQTCAAVDALMDARPCVMTPARLLTTNRYYRWAQARVAKDSIQKEKVCVTPPASATTPMAKA